MAEDDETTTDHGPAVTTWADAELPSWVTSDAELARLPLGVPICIAAAPAASPWDWVTGTTAGRVILHRPGSTTTLSGHANWVRSVSWSADGTRLASIGREGVVHVWDMSDPSRVTLISATSTGAPANAGVLSPDGRTVVVGTTHGAVLIPAGATSAFDTLVSESVTAVGWQEADGTIALGTAGGTVLVGGPTRFDLLHAGFHAGAVSDLAWTPMGTCISASADGALVIAGSPDSAAPAPDVGRWRSVITGLAWRRSTNELTIGDRDGVISSAPLDAILGEGRRSSLVAIRQPAAVTSFAWDVGETRLATTSDDGSAGVWQPGPGFVEVARLGGHTARLRTVAWHPDGGRIATGGDDGRTRVWSTLERRATATIGQISPARSVAWSPEGSALAIGSRNGGVLVVDPSSEQVPDSVAVHRGACHAVAWSSDGRLGSGGDDGVAYVRDETGRPVQRRLGGRRDPARSVAWLGDRLVAGTDDCVVVIWHVDQKRTMGDTDTGTGEVRGLAVHPRLPTIAIASNDHLVRIWDTTGRTTEPRQLRGHRDSVRSIAWNGTGTRLVTGGVDRRVCLWDPERARPLVTLTGHVNTVNAVAWNPAGDHVVSASADGTIRFWRGGDEWSFEGAHVAWASPAPVGGRREEPAVATDEPVIRIHRSGTTRGTPTIRRDHLDAHRTAIGLDQLLRDEIDPDHPDASLAPSIAVNVDAAWGRGKSTLLTHLVALPPRERTGAEWLVIHHDAWRHSRTSPSWWALARDLHQEIKASRTAVGRRRLARADLAGRARTTIGWIPMLLLAATIATLAAALVLTSWFDGTSGSAEVTTFLTVVTSVIAAIALVGGLGTRFRRFLRWTHAPGSDALSAAPTTPLAQAAVHVEWLRRQALLGADGRPTDDARPILFIVDELDRCPAEVVVDVLDSIHTLMRRDVHGVGAAPERLAPIAFVVLADSTWIRRAYQKIHDVQDEVTTDGQTLGALFHAKLFDLVLTLPPVTPSRFQAFAQSTLDELTGSSGAEARRLLDGTAPPSGGAEAAPAPTAGDEDPAPAAPARAAGRPSRDGGPPMASGDTPSEAPEVVTPLDDDEVRDIQQTASTAGREELTVHLLQDHIGLMPRNPRAFKRVVNDLALHDITRSDHPDGERVTDEELVRWVVLNQRWPDVADRLLTLPGLDVPGEVTIEVLDAHLRAATRPFDLEALVRSRPVQKVWPVVVPGEGGSGDTLDGRYVEAVAILAGEYADPGATR